MSRATESWAEWILSSYFESINSPPAEVVAHAQDSSDDNTPTTTSSLSTNTSPDTTSSRSSSWGPYTKTGRGGYGNFKWQSDNDIEAQQQRQPSIRCNSHHASTTTTTTEPYSRKRRPANILISRNSAVSNTAVVLGTANVPATYTPGMTPRSPTWAISPDSYSHSPPTASSTTTTAVSTPRSASDGYGRGGARNFAAASSLALALAATTAKGEKMAEERRRVAEHDVEGMLRPPEDAFLAGARRRESAVGVVASD